MPFQILPLTPNPNQTFLTSLNIDGGVGDQYIGLRYNETAQYWVMTLFDANGNIVLDSIPFITGEAPAANILGQFAYLKLGSAFILNASAVAQPPYPNDEDLGSDYVLIWGDTPA